MVYLNLYLFMIKIPGQDEILETSMDQSSDQLADWVHILVGYTEHTT